MADCPQWPSRRPRIYRGRPETDCRPGPPQRQGRAVIPQGILVGNSHYLIFVTRTPAGVPGALSAAVNGGERKRLFPVGEAHGGA